MFAKFILAAALMVFCLSLQVSAHAGVSPALGVKGTLQRSDVQRPSKAKPCGNVNIAQTLNNSTAIAMTGTTFTANVTNFNPGQDGSRKVSAEVDSTAVGKTFVAATVSKNGDPAPTSDGTQQITVELPTGTKCTGGDAKDLCLVSFTTSAGFGNCVVVKQGAAKRDVRAVGSRAARAFRSDGS
ncbi:hypothetical protein JAAARDRAFT_178938 [Jaapia argillacea MUCL 33604]|uniref:Uncharacterized protein n=1 Tax=Jaapia argillacea MUCL 33604 TaxID=933084 RepID=A0A067PR90_9AGAM|nr:hypothetical protein JAAARDRAFT_178938 [Jaapia argillacea MUCL 33604]